MRRMEREAPEEVVFVLQVASPRKEGGQSQQGQRSVNAALPCDWAASRQRQCWWQQR